MFWNEYKLVTLEFKHAQINNKGTPKDVIYDISGVSNNTPKRYMKGIGKKFLQTCP